MLHHQVLVWKSVPVDGGTGCTTLFNHYQTRPAGKGLTLIRDESGIPRWEKATDLGDVLDKSVTHTINGKVVSERDARLAAESLRQGTDEPDIATVDSAGKKFSKLGGFAQRPSRASPGKSASSPKDGRKTGSSPKRPVGGPGKK